LAWQLGHLISSSVDLLHGIAPDKAITLPPGFKEQHSKEVVGSDDPDRFLTKAQYQALLTNVRESTAAAIDSFSDADFDRPGPEWLRPMFPTVGNVLTLISAHPLMHAGQFVVVRRKLGKPILI
jgi:hypothetical protein